MRRLARHLRSERGDGVIETLIVLGVVLFVIVVAVQLLLYAHARSIAQGAAQDGARAAAVESSGAGVARADRILAAAGGTGDRLQVGVRATEIAVTVQVVGAAPRIFPVGFAVPRIATSATLPIERYAETERLP